ncbi:MAG: tetratricopeptide repeat protein [Ignavibacteria bacterium]|nr:tetratricopeptide repeat protein [Ignavibacteria bacterium]
MITMQCLHADLAQAVRRLLQIILSLCAIAVFAGAQQVDIVAKLRLAQSFEQTGVWDRAVTIYESLLESNPQNFVILEGLRRSYMELKRYDKAMELVRQQLRGNPTDENLLSILGGLYDLAGQPQTADSIWHVVIKKDPKNANLYRLIAAQLVDHRQYDKAIEIYLEGREATKNQSLFVEELASLYGALHQYESATHEYVKIVRANPQQMTYIQSRLSSFTGREEGRRAALGVIKDEVARNKEEVPLYSILAWLFMEGKHYEAALEQYRIIDRLTKAKGSELFQFGQRAAQEHAYLPSAKAFREVVDGKPAANIVPFARFGYARAIEELSVENDTIARAPGQLSSGVGRGSTISETQPTFQGAMALYESLIMDHPNTETAMQALFRIGTIRFTRFFDLSGAAAAFDKVRTMPFSSNLMYEATLSLAEVQTARNDLGRTRGEYDRLLSSSPEPYRDRVLFRLAELNYFEARFDSASAVLQRISGNATNDLTNDALQLLYFIQENKTAGQAALTEFALADLMVRQRKYSEAIVRFQSVLTQHPTTALVDDATMRIGELQLLLNRVDDALAVFRTVTNDMPASILRDHAQMRIGEIYENRLKNKQKAIDAYEHVLANYPTSLFVEEARKRIRMLRGDSL